jgi:BlaI family penicillinase repressor
MGLFGYTPRISHPKSVYKEELVMPKKISDAELEVMCVLWRGKRPLSFTEIRKELETKMSWNKSTIHTLLTRLRDKGIVSTTFHHVTLFSSNITEDEYMQGFIDMLFDGRAINYMTNLCRSGKLSEEDIDKLKDLFEKGGP